MDPEAVEHLATSLAAKLAGHERELGRAQKSEAEYRKELDERLDRIQESVDALRFRTITLPVLLSSLALALSTAAVILAIYANRNNFNTEVVASTNKSPQGARRLEANTVWSGSKTTSGEEKPGSDGR